ncbi:hypothetical protein FSP39_001550 [Pinctada imbricata]|uniref:Syntaxin-18 n=1 Tax=Pinctada imbricata TaxID=66713 RepID=A0AA88XYD6_PINIB|nr:hypothetical protein FSP39_001550 [Pinctada imbricata]
MADVTNVFKAVIKAQKSKNKALNGTEENDKTIFPPSKHRGEFETKSRQLVASISKLKEFLLSHRKEYVNAGSLLSMETSAMTDSERDQIEAEAEKIIKQCRETIGYIRNMVETQVVHPQVKEHRHAVLKLLEEYLKVVCKIYTEQKAVRVKRVVDRKRISKLETELLYKQRRINSTVQSKNSTVQSKSKEKDMNQSSKVLKSQPKTTNEGPSSSSQKATESQNRVALEESSQFSDDDISPEEAQMFEKENEVLFEEMNSLVSEISQIEGKVLEVAKLQEIFTEKVLEQEKDIDRIEQTVVGTTENIKDANEEIREAMKNSAGFRVWILFFLLVCTLSLLFLDWYNG